MSDEEAGGGHLLHNLLLFGRVLRRLGLDADPGRMLDLATALGHVQVGRKQDFHHAARCLLVRRREDMALFDVAFEAFWRRPREGTTSLDLLAMGERRRFRRPTFAPPPLGGTGLAAAAAGEPPAADAPPVVLATRTWSDRDLLRHKDFGELTETELEQVRALIAELAFDPGERRTRRTRPGDGPRLDLRGSLRRSLHRGGELLDWSRREPRMRPRPVVTIADISGSMERYTRLLLLFCYGLVAKAAAPVEAFVFGTRLTRITREIRGRDAGAALARVARAVPDWSGGTRIGDNLKSFNLHWSRRVLRSSSIVLLISDGWDRGEPELLQREMARLQRSCHRLIWLNPLLGAPGYEPVARGMAAALPYCDDFLPVRDLASLEDLAAQLASLGAARRARRLAGGAPRAGRVDAGRTA